MFNLFASLLNVVRGKRSASPRYPVDRQKLEQMLDFTRLRGLSGKGSSAAPDRWIGGSILFQHTRQNVKVRVDSPPFKAGEVRTIYPSVRWSWQPHHLCVYLVDGVVECRASHQGLEPREAMPLASDPADLAEIARCFDFWYDELGLPAALEQPAEPERPRLQPSGNVLRDVATYLEFGTADAFADLFGEGGPVVWVDWGDEDDLIVERVAAALSLAGLRASFEEPRGDLVIRHGEAVHHVRYAEPWVADRDSTIIGLNQALLPGHELRLCTIWNGSDTVALMALPRETWSTIEQAHPDQHSSAFQPIKPGVEIFGSD